MISIALAEKIVGKSSFFGDTKAFARLVYYLYVVSVFIFLFSFWSNLSSHFQYHHLKTHHHHNHHHEQRRHHHHHHHYRHHYHHHHQHHLHHWLFENVVPLFSFFLCTILTFLVSCFFQLVNPILANMEGRVMKNLMQKVTDANAPKNTKGWNANVSKKD